MEPRKILSRLLDEKEVTIFIDRDKWNVVNNNNFDIKNRKYFILLAERKRFLANIRSRFWNENHEMFNYYIEPYGVKIWLNYKRIRYRVKLNIHDKITIDDKTFSLNDGYHDDQFHPLIRVNNIEIAFKHNRKIETIVQRTSFEIRRGEFVAIMGPSGCGKTTLLKELAGANNHTHGEIKIGDLPIEKYFHSDLKTKIGYVPQFDSLHNNLTVYQTLFFKAKIRRIRWSKSNIIELLHQLNIYDLKDKLIESLSGGQKKKVAIATELLDDPDILLLDEPTSPLDPESVDEFLKIMKKLAVVHNKAVVMVTHKPTDKRYAHRIIFLSKLGYNVYNGSSSFFPENLEKEILSNNKPLNSEDTLLGVYKYFSEDDNKQHFINLSRKLNNQNFALSGKNVKAKSYRQSFNFFIQLYWLLLRYAKIKFPNRESANEKQNNIFKNLFTGWLGKIKEYMVQPIIVGLLFFAFPNFTITPLFLISLAVIWFSVNNASKEIVEELPIYHRERSFNLKIDTYLLSKIILLTFISALQIVVLLSIVWLRFHFYRTGNYPDLNLYAPIQSGIFLLVLSIAATILGLLASTLFEKVEKVLMIVPLLLIPQIIFSGLVSKPDIAIKENLSYCMLGRWGLEGLSRIQDLNSFHYSARLPNGIIVKNSNSVVIEGIAPLPFDTLVFHTTDAMYALGSYNNNLRRDNTKAWIIFNNIKGNYCILIIHIFLLYFVCRLLLMTKDSIPLNRNLSRKILRRLLSSIGILIISMLLLSILLKEKKNSQLIWNATSPKYSDNMF